MSGARPTLDWQEAYARLERARQALESGGERSPEEVRRTLRERARALARPREEPRAPAETLELVVFSLAGERYGIETARVLEVIPLRDLTSVPSAPAVILGVVNYRGRILPVLDGRRLLALAGEGIPEGSQVVAVHAEGMTFGLFTTGVEGVVRIAADQVAPVPLTLTRAHPALLRGVTGAMVAVLDLDAVARDPRIVVNEEVG